MDVDNDIDNAFIQRFSSMGTTDRDVLIQEFQRVLGNQLNRDGCAFFLDMNNWNLQEAICSYFDFGAPREKVPHMTIVADETVTDGQTLPPNTNFVKTWQIKNSGDEAWPAGCLLKFSHGAALSGDVDRVGVEPCRAGQACSVSVHMRTPHTPGMHEAQWRLFTAQGVTFGEVLWVVVSVDDGNVEGMAEQLQGFHLHPHLHHQQQHQQQQQLEHNHCDITSNHIDDTDTVTTITASVSSPHAHNISDVGVCGIPQAAAALPMPIPHCSAAMSVAAAAAAGGADRLTMSWPSSATAATHLSPHAHGSPASPAHCIAPHNSPNTGTYVTAASASASPPPPPPHTTIATDATPTSLTYEDMHL